MKRRILSLMLTLCMLASLFPALTTKAGAAEGQGGSSTDLLNLDQIEPAGLQNAVNPYGYEAGQPFLLIEQNELLLYNSRKRDSNDSVNNVTWYDTYRSAGSSAIFDDTGVFQNKATISPGDTATSGTLRLVQGTAFDPFGTGRKDHVAYVGVGNGGSAYLWVVDEDGEQLGGSVDLGKMYWAHSRMDNFEQYMNGQQFLNVVAGDFDGDHKDSLVVYVALDKQPGESSWTSKGSKIVEYRVYSSGLSSALSYDKSLLHTEYIAKENTFAGSGEEGKSEQYGVPADMLATSMAVGDFNADGKDDLAVVSYINRTEKKDLAKEIYIPQLRVAYGGSGTILNQTVSFSASLELDHPSEDDRLIIPAAPTVSAGRIDGSDNYEDLIVAGLKGGLRLKGSNADGVLRDTDCSKLHILAYSGGANKTLTGILNDASTQANAWTDGGQGGDRDKVNSPVITACVATNGGGAQNDVFINGDLYLYNGQGFVGGLHKI